MNLRRTLLFVPGNRPERFPKAVASGADMVCLDLEDSVPAAEKAAARVHIKHYLDSYSGQVELVVRINTLRSRDGLEDLLAMATATPISAPWMLSVPKVESAGELLLARSVLAESGSRPELLALIESIKGLQCASEIAAVPGIALVGIGTADLAAELGTGMDWEPMLYARQQVSYASRAARVGALDGAWPSLDDAEGLAQETRRATALGFTAKPCLHPRQVAVVHEALLPSEAEVVQARRIVEAFDAAEGRAIQVDGRLIDRPVAESARRKISAWARERGES